MGSQPERSPGSFRQGRRMKFLYSDESFSFETLRAAGFAVDGGADLGEVLVTARAIAEGDEVAWHREWKALADRVANLGDDSLKKGHKVSAREAFLRASNYYRTAEFFRREDPFNDAEVSGLSRRSRDTFWKAAQLMDNPVEDVRISYEGRSLPAYLLFVDATRQPRPTVIYNNGFDSTREEAYFAIAAAALRHGYNVIAFDGPGQGAALREERLFFRPDWEVVIGSVLDFAGTRSEFAIDRIALFGYSMGAYLVARAAAFDKRPAALILDDGLYEFFGAMAALMPPFLATWIKEGKDDAFAPVVQWLMNGSTGLRWAMRNGMWAFGASSVADYLHRTESYTLEGIIQQIKCPALVMEAEEDMFLRQQAAKVDAGLTSPHRRVTLHASEGASAHCHMGAMKFAHQIIFDWLDETFAQTSR